MGSRARWLGAGVLALLLATPALLVWNRDLLAPPGPPPLELKIGGPDDPDFAAAASQVSLEAAGIRVALPKGTRIHPNMIDHRPGLSRVHARLHGLPLVVTFYGEDRGTLGDRYQAAMKGEVPKATGELLFGTARPIEKARLEASGGRVLRFELDHGEGRRESVLVARPATGPGLATVRLTYPFDPRVARVAQALAQGIAFPAPPPS